MVAETRQTERVQNYSKRWEKESSKDTDAHKQSRLDEYTEVVNGESCIARYSSFTAEIIADMGDRLL